MIDRRSLREWLADVFIGPKCLLCGWRSRGHRSLARHEARRHPAGACC